MKPGLLYTRQVAKKPFETLRFILKEPGVRRFCSTIMEAEVCLN